MTSTITLTACLSGKTFPGSLDWKVSRFPCSQYSMTIIIKSLAWLSKSYLRINIRIWLYWGGWASSWCRFIGRCIFARKVSS